MITKKDISALEFETIEEYYLYVLTSYLNGQIKQAKELASKLDSEQKEACIDHLDTLHFYEKLDLEADRDEEQDDEKFYRIVGLKNTFLVEDTSHLDSYVKDIINLMVDKLDYSETEAEDKLDDEMKVVEMYLHNGYNYIQAYNNLLKNDLI